MSLFARPPQPEVLPGVNPAEDCQPPATPAAAPPPNTLFHDWLPRRTALERGLEKLSLALEAPLNRWLNAPQLNPLYHTGTLTILLLFIIGLTGVYLFFFYSYGFDESYASLAQMQAVYFNQLARGIHRYASGAALFTSLLHAYRIFFMGRFRGPRWLAWVSGIALSVLLWLGGVTGYWLIADQRAQLLNISFIDFLRAFTPLSAWFATLLIQAEQTRTSWPIMAVLFLVHLGIFGAVLALTWTHLSRLKRPKFAPPYPWLWGSLFILIAAAVLFPVELLPQANSGQLPGAVTLDPLFLFFLPATYTGWAAWLWVGLAVTLVAGAAVPWWLRRPAPPRPAPPPKVTIDQALCTGCTKCALDCPYGAIQMVPRTDGKRHKFTAQEHSDLCVACGLCVGSCDVLAVSLGDWPAASLDTLVTARLAAAQQQHPGQPVRVVFTCERHAAHGAQPFLSGEAGVQVITLPCVGAAHPNLVAHTVSAGAVEVRVVGCPPDDCANREGNLWAQQRLARQRLPRLRRTHTQAAISTAWIPPNAFEQALAEATPQAAEHPWRTDKHDGPAGVGVFTPLTWKNYLPLLALMLVATLALAGVNQLWVFAPYAATEARAHISLPSPAALVANPANAPWQLTLTLDNIIIYTHTLPVAALGQAVFHEFPLEPGTHHLDLRLTNPNGVTVIIHQRQVTVAAGQIVLLTPLDAPTTNPSLR